MLRRRMTPLSTGALFRDFGIELDQAQYQKIKEKIEILKDKCPAQCSFDLRFEKRKSCYVGELSIRSLSGNFYAKRIAYNPYQTYLMLEEAIEFQLLDWRRKRFSANLEQSLSEIGEPLRTA